MARPPATAACRQTISSNPLPGARTAVVLTRVSQLHERALGEDSVNFDFLTSPGSPPQLMRDGSGQTITGRISPLAFKKNFFRSHGSC
jgi:hypothetical protein